MKRYAIGVDFGTLSARALLLDGETGAEIASSTKEYPHGVMETALPTGERLGPDWALQDPQDYVDCLICTVKNVMTESGVPAEQVVGIGLDFTSCTILPVKRDGTPLCQMAEFSHDPHAYVKLWKHHAAQYCADQLNETAERMGQEWLALYGGKISSEWLVPKTMQIVKEAPYIYDAADRIIEAGDWLVWKLCGQEVRSACNAGYKALWHHTNGYPSSEFLAALDPRLENLVEEKLSTDIHPVGSRAGYLTPEMAEAMGLTTNTAVAVEIVDAHASVPACGIHKPGKMLMIMGTSTCHMLLSDREKGVPGSCGIVKDGILPGYYAYEAGQSCVGDHFSWFIDNCLPASYVDEAKERGIGLHQLLREKADKLKPGESGLVALDWFNGVRSILMDADRTGLILGMTLQTKPEEIYRALIEATAYGTRNIIEAFEEAGVAVDELAAAGGIAAKDPMTMQIYADVCNREIQIAASTQSGALGSAILGLVSAGPEKSGYDTVGEAVAALGSVREERFRPIPENVRAYEELFREYKLLHDYFGRGGNDVMRRLKRTRAEIANKD